MACGHQCTTVALYLLTCPTSNMTGLYYMPIGIISHDTRSPLEGASEALRSLEECGFLKYDLETEQVFVKEMARFQIGEKLKASDKRVKGVHKIIKTFKDSPFFNDFCERYRDDFHLGLMYDLGSPLEGASEALRSKEKEKEKEKEKKSLMSQARASDAALRLSELLLGRIRMQHPTFKEPNVDSWAKQFDQIMALDHRTEDQVASMIARAHSDKFWYKNILSPKKLREHWDRLILETKAPESTGALGLPVSKLGVHGQAQAAIGQDWLNKHEGGDGA